MRLFIPDRVLMKLDPLQVQWAQARAARAPDARAWRDDARDGSVLEADPQTCIAVLDRLGLSDV